jgi:hypothetical protein
LYFAPNIVRIVKERRIRLDGHVALKRAMENAYILWGRSSEDLGIE